jgi:succinylglutamate desuccinylase
MDNQTLYNKIRALLLIANAEQLQQIKRLVNNEINYEDERLKSKQNDNINADKSARKKKIVKKKVKQKGLFGFNPADFKIRI